MKIKIVIFLIISFVVVFGLSCKKDCYRELSPEEMSRLGYTGGEIIVFKLNTGLIDTAKVTVVSPVKIEVDGKCKDYGMMYKRYLDFSSYFPDSIFKSDDTSHYKAGMAVRIYEPKKKSDAVVYPEISFYGSYNFEIAQKSDLTIQGLVVKDVYFLPVQTEIPQYNVKQIYFSFQYGLIRIDLKNGNYLERINI